MRSLGLAVVALAFTASPATAAVIELEDHYCGCDGSSGDTDTVGIIVRAAPGELNRITVRGMPRGVLIQDAGAPLTGRCRPSPARGRFCRGVLFDGVSVYLHDGDDRIQHDFGGYIDGGPGDDEIVGSSSLGATFRLAGGPGADRLEAHTVSGSTVSYASHTDGVTVRLDGLANDGAVGEGDNVLGTITGIAGGSGDDRLELGASGGGLFGGDGADTLLGSPEHDTMDGGDGNDELLAGAGNDYLSGGAGADLLSGGPDLDEVAYGGPEPLQLSIGDGPNDGAPGEGDDIRGDVESLTGGRGDDLLIGDDDPTG
jgi:Ca2+-binding RTX toxin-like protein